VDLEFEVRTEVFFEGYTKSVEEVIVEGYYVMVLFC
jgi:hypothetical protein